MFLFVAGNFGDFIVCCIQKHFAKEAAENLLKQALPDSELTIINLEKEKNNIRWEEEDEEFSLHGLMYDVAKVIKTENGTFIYCLNDEQEEAAMKKFSKAISSNTENNSNDKGGKHAAKFQMSEFCFDHYEKDAITPPSVLQIFINFKNSITSITKEVNAPPPKC